MKHKVLEYNAIFQKEDEGFSVWVPSLPGCTSQGETFEDAMSNIKEAIELYLDDNSEAQESNVDIKSQFMVPITVQQTV